MKCAEIVVWLAVNAEGERCLSLDSAADAADDLISKYGVSVGMRTVSFQLLVELPLAQSALAHAPVNQVFIPVPAIAPADQNKGG